MIFLSAYYVSDTDVYIFLFELPLPVEWGKI